MTRLKTHDIEDIPEGLREYDAGLREKTGHSLVQIGCHAAGLEENTARDLIGTAKIGVVPMTCGQGIITGFSHVVEAIVRHLGFDAFTSRRSDVAGIAEAAAENPDILMMADDDRFVALVLNSLLVVDNGTATGRGFAAGLDLMAGGLKGERALVIGCGPVGHGAALGLIHFGASVSVYDIDPRRAKILGEDLQKNSGAEVKVADSLGDALGGHGFVIEATNAANVIDGKALQAGALIAAPGMPLGLTKPAYNKAKQVLHDPLQIGVATMAVMAVSEMEKIGSEASHGK